MYEFDVFSLRRMKAIFANKWLRSYPAQKMSHMHLNHKSTLGAGRKEVVSDKDAFQPSWIQISDFIFSVRELQFHTTKMKFGTKLNKIFN